MSMLCENTKSLSIMLDTANVLRQIIDYSHRHSLLKEAATANISHERSFSIPTAKVFPFECFAIQGI